MEDSPPNCPAEFLSIEIQEGESDDIYEKFRTKNSSNYNPDQPVQNEAGEFECPQCPYTSKIGRFVYNHIVRVHTPLEQVEWYYCSYCLFKTRTAVGIKVHTSHAHENPTRVRCLEGFETTDPNTADWYKCKLCPYKGRKIHHLTSHMFHMHSPASEMRWKCEKCSFKCKLKHAYKNHIKNVHPKS